MNIILSKNENMPFYRQIYNQIVCQILQGQLVGEEPLPSIRFVAKELNISVITVKNAYEQLEKDGYIYTLAAKGSYVKQQQNKKEIKLELATDRLKTEIEYYKTLGLTIDEIFDIVKNLF